MTKQEATKAISEKTAQAMKLIREAEQIANESGEGFRFSVAYGMGGSYHPRSDKKEKREAALAKLTPEEIELLNLDDMDDDDDDCEGWQASSQSC